MELILFALLAVLLVFMFVNTRKRNKQMKAAQEEKAAKTVPGAKVLLQGGLYGTVVSYNPDDLDAPAKIELAPGTVVEVHSQAILRVIDPEDAEGDADTDTDADADTDTAPSDDAFDVPASDPLKVETPEETRARLDRETDSK